MQSIFRIINNATMNFYVQAFSEHLFSVVLCVYLGLELLDHMVGVCLVFEELLDCFPKQLNHFTFPPAAYEVPIFSNPHYLLSAFVLIIVKYTLCNVLSFLVLIVVKFT